MKLADMERGRALKKWALALNRAKVAGLTGEDIALQAENYMFEWGYVPPHWTGYVDCANCGHVPTWPRFKGEKVTVCVWCCTGYFDFDLHHRNGSGDLLN